MNALSLVTLAAVSAPKEEWFGLSLQLAVVGMLVVFTALAAIQTLLVALGRATRDRAEARPEVTVPAAPEPTAPAAVIPAPAEQGGPSPEVLAVIAATVAAVVGHNARITRVHLVGIARNSAWAEHGRRDHHTSHRLRKKS